MQNVEKTIVSQYANSPALLQIIGSFNAAIDPAADLENILTNIWDVNTAQGFGLDILGRIVGVSRFVIESPQLAGGNWFGFENWMPFDQAPMLNGTTGPGSNVPASIPDDMFRLMIKAKALANISGASASAINATLITLFPNRGPTFVIDGLDMTIRYFFGFSLTTNELSVISQDGILPRPAGVQASIQQVPYSAFGFEGWMPFDRGQFAPDNSLTEI
jgi:Protein of unknown function (DUF2612)